MSVDFMTGAILFTLIKLVGMLFAIWIGYRIWTKVTNFVLDDSAERHMNFKWELVAAAVLTFFGLFAGAAMQPKVTIDVPVNRELKQYQTNDQEIVIKTPAPRTEKLNGFKPLGE